MVHIFDGKQHGLLEISADCRFFTGEWENGADPNRLARAFVRLIATGGQCRTHAAQTQKGSMPATQASELHAERRHRKIREPVTNTETHRLANDASTCFVYEQIDRTCCPSTPPISAFS